jgi:ATP-binding cassette subfamily B multidrug efflux pump
MAGHTDRRPGGRRAASGAPEQSGVKKGTMKRLVSYLFSLYGGRLIVAVLCMILASIASSVASMFIQRLVDEGITPGIQNGFSAVSGIIVRILVTMGLVYLISVAATIINTQILARVTQGTLKHVRDAMFDRMQDLPIRYFDTHPHGAVMSTYTNDTDALRQLIGQSIPQLITGFLTILVTVFVMLYYSLWLTLTVFLAIALMAKVSAKLGKASGHYMMRQQSALAAEEGFAEEMIQGQKVVKVFCHEQESIDRFSELNEQLFHDSNEANKAGNVLMPILGNLGNILYVILAIVGGFLIVLRATNVSLRGVDVVSLGVIVSFLGMARMMSQTVSQVSMQMSMITMGLAGAQRIFELIDEEPEQDEGYVTLVNTEQNPDGTLRESGRQTGRWAWKHFHKDDGTTTYVPLAGDVRMEHVDFGYTPDKQILHDVTLYAKPGQKIAFVGATGAGKTTITNLLNRFYDIPDGKIRYDGINITKIKKPDLRRSLGMVLQDVNLFTGTVMENIRYGRLDATDEECIRAAKLANADGFIRRLPDGYDTVLTGNGAKLSAGQRQLLSIARAAVADPPVMILDEATSSIDTRTESLVQEGMDNLMKGRTVFVIAHRLSTVRNSDAIMVLDHGRIIERGTHDDLIAQKGTYYQLYTGAFELE